MKKLDRVCVVECDREVLDGSPNVRVGTGAYGEHRQVVLVLKAMNILQENRLVGTLLRLCPEQTQISTARAI